MADYEKKYRFVLNLSMLGKSPTGLGVYARHCAESIEKYFNCTIITNYYEPKTGCPVIASPANISIGAGKLSPIRRLLYSCKEIKRELDFVYTPTHHGMIRHDRQIITIHDLICIHHPRQHLFQYLFFKTILPLLIKKSTAIFTVSETARDEISRYYSVDKKRIFVVPDGVDQERYTPGKDFAGSVKNYLLVVGAAYPHKNILELLQNWQLWKGRYRVKIVSAKGKYERLLKSFVEENGLVEVVDFLGYVSDENLVCLYQNCSALVFPSLWEGFGLPPIEALACGRPVIASDIAVHKEVLGDSVFYITPGEPETWQAAFTALAMETVVEDKVSKGLQRVRELSWQKSGDKLVSALLTVYPQLALSKKCEQLNGEDRTPQAAAYFPGG